MEFQIKQDLDLILVPAGLLILFIYHLYLLYRLLKYPSTTAIGYENHNWMAWVANMMQTSNASAAISVISNSTSSSTYVAFNCFTMCGFIGMWVGNSSSNAVNTVFILGNTSPATISLKDMTMFFAFLMSFGGFIQSVRYYVQANSIISMPNTDVPVDYVQRLMLLANNFWHIGLRLLYFAMVLLFWSFGPIPMFLSCVIMVMFLFFLDSNGEPLHQFGPVAKLPVKKVVEEDVGA